MYREHCASKKKENGLKSKYYNNRDWNLILLFFRREPFLWFSWVPNSQVNVSVPGKMQPELRCDKELHLCVCNIRKSYMSVYV